jgi:hypothetical protein
MGEHAAQPRYEPQVVGESDHPSARAFGVVLQVAQHFGLTPENMVSLGINCMAFALSRSDADEAAIEEVIGELPNDVRTVVAMMQSDARAKAN